LFEPLALPDILSVDVVYHPCSNRYKLKHSQIVSKMSPTDYYHYNAMA